MLVLDKTDYLIAYQFEKGLIYKNMPYWVQYLFDEEIFYNCNGTWTYGSMNIESGVYVIKKNNRLEVMKETEFKERFVMI